MKKKLLSVFLCLLFIIPAYAVFNEKNTSKTISILRHELHLIWQDKQKQQEKQEKTSQMAEVQHKKMVNAINWINELTLILYSQNRDFTLDQTYAMEGVMSEYEKFQKRRSPRFTNIDAINTEIERYQRLIEALRLLPPKLDVLDDVPDSLRRKNGIDDPELEAIRAFLDSLSLTLMPTQLLEKQKDSAASSNSRKNLFLELATYGRYSKDEAADTSGIVSYILPEQAQVDRDSCIAYARAIINSFNLQKGKIEADERYYTEMHSRLQQNYEYSKSRYEEIQKYIFITGQDNYFNVLSNLRRYVMDVADEMDQKYGSGDADMDRKWLHESQWRGFFIAGVLVYALSRLLLITLIISLLFCVILKKIRPFNTEWFRQTRPVVIILAVSVVSFFITVSRCFFPLSNSMRVAAGLIIVYLWFLIALLLSVLIRLKASDAKEGFKAFLPMLTMGLLIMYWRALFLPDKMINLILTPILLAIFLWQIHAVHRFVSRCKDYKKVIRLQYVTTVVFGASLVYAISGYSLLTLMFIMWWVFQVTALATLATAIYILRYYEKKKLIKKREEYAISHKMVSKDEDGDYIRVTWLFDLVSRVIIPVSGIISVLACIHLAAGVFNLTETCKLIFHKPFFDFTNADGDPILQVSLYKLALVGICFFIFRYLNYLLRALYRINTFEKVMQASGSDFVRKNDVNLTLAYNVIGILIWGIFILYAIYIMKIPIAAISIVAAGLATGIGLALKDVLNNFIYGIQLMSGRLRVGDMLECDGIRGTVEKISYQSTEIETLDGAVISFTNSTLFNKNFQNLTKNTPYEFVSVIVSISYGEDVGKVRKIILEALSPFNKKKDKYGRYVVERKSGIWVTFDEFCDSSVNLAIKQNVLVESKIGYTAEVKELIYKLFNEKGIVIPFPQQEVSILNFKND